MISVIIPTYKNRGQFLANLKHNLQYLKGIEIIVVNDNPKESLKKDLRLFHDREKVVNNFVVVENERNLGFGQSVNKGVAKAKNPYIMLLNDDVILKDNDFEKAVDHFKKDHNLFAVSFAQIEKNKNIVGKNILYWKKGFIHHEKKHDMKTGSNAWAEGGACIIDKAKFNMMGGFNTLYSPFYWEDVDLSYQAYRYGFHVLFDSEIQVIHHHESTIGRVFSTHYIQTIAFRNQLLFIWKNIDSLRLLSEHFIYFFPTVAKGGVPFIRGFFQTIPYLWTILVWKNNHRNLKPIISDSKLTLP